MELAKKLAQGRGASLRGLVLPSASGAGLGGPRIAGAVKGGGGEDDAGEEGASLPLPSRWETLRRDALAGTITGLMAIPLNAGIAIMSEYPIMVALATVALACVISFLVYQIRPGNHIGVPGVAAGLAPVLALCVHSFGMENMPFLIFLTSVFQLVVWKYRLERYLLKVVPPFLIEGLLAGVGLKIVVKFFEFTYATRDAAVAGPFWSEERILVVGSSAAAFLLFLWLYRRFKDSQPGIPYIAIIGASVILARYRPFAMIDVQPVEFALASPVAAASRLSPWVILQIVGFALMLGTIDIIEQVMSNAAIERIDPLHRKTDSNNSLLTIWIANLVASLFGGMTNLDGLAKSSTNRMAGALTKTSNLFVAAVLIAALLFPSSLNYLPKFSLGVLMIFTGWKMIAGLIHTASHGNYGFGMGLVCGILVFRLGIFEGLLICLVLHSFIVFVVYRHKKVRIFEIIERFLAVFSERGGKHPHQTGTLAVATDDEVTGAVVYRSVSVSPSAAKTLDEFIGDWADGVNRHNALSVVGTYDAGGLLWGTFAKDLREGHFHIKRYFDHLFELDDVKVRFDSGETRSYGDIHIRSGTYAFIHRKRGDLIEIPARYSFVCKREKNGWYILEHHSSEFPA